MYSTRFRPLFLAVYKAASARLTSGSTSFTPMHSETAIPILIVIDLSTPPATTGALAIVSRNWLARCIAPSRPQRAALEGTPLLHSGQRRHRDEVWIAAGAR